MVDSFGRYFRHQERCHDDESGGGEGILKEVADEGYAAMQGGWKLLVSRCSLLVSREEVGATGGEPGIVCSGEDYDAAGGCRWVSFGGCNQAQDLVIDDIIVMQDFRIELSVGMCVCGVGPGGAASGIHVNAVGDAGLLEIVTPSSGVLAGIASDPCH